MLSNWRAVLRKTLEQRLCRLADLVVAAARAKGQWQDCRVNRGEGLWARGPQLSSTHRCCQRSPYKEEFKDTQHSGQVMQALGFIKVNSGDVRLGKLERELRALEYGFLSLIDCCEQGGGSFITWGGDAGFRAPSFLAWSGISCHSTRHLGPVWFNLASGGVLPRWALTFLRTGRDSLLAGLPASCWGLATCLF